MSSYSRIEVTSFTGGETTISIVRFVDRKLIYSADIKQARGELVGLLAEKGLKHIVLNFANLEFLSSEALCALILLEKNVRKAGGVLRFCNVRPEIYEVFAITRLNQLFDVKGTEGEALANWPLSAAA